MLSWKKLLAHPNMWYVCVMYFCYGYVLWIFLSWLPTYFAEVRGFGLVKSGIYTMIPLLAGTVTNSLGGWFSDRLYVRTGDLRYSRRLVAITGFAIAVVFVTVGCFGAGCHAGGARHVGGGGRAGTDHRCVMGHSSGYRARSFRNGFGCHEHVWELGRSHFAASGGLAGSAIRSWTPAFILASFLCLVAGLLWFKIDPTISVVEESG